MITESTVFRVPFRPGEADDVRPDDMIRIEYDDFAHEVFRVRHVYELADGKRLLEIAKLDLPTFGPDALAVKINPHRVSPN